MEIEKSTTDKSKLIAVVIAIILAGTFFGSLGYLLGSKENNTDKPKNQIVKDEDRNQDIEVEEEEIDNEEKEGIENIEDETADWKTYTNDEYGFEITLLNSWKGYSILTESWSGTTLDGNSTKYQGPQIIIRNPKWSTAQPWQDIPVMVFTKEEWELIEAKNLNVNPAPVGPQKLDENQKYVFALPPRWIGYSDALGQNEAQEIAKTIKAISFVTTQPL